MTNYSARPTETDEQETWDAAGILFRAELGIGSHTTEQYEWALHIERISSDGLDSIFECMTDDRRSMSDAERAQYDADYA